MRLAFALGAFAALSLTGASQAQTAAEIYSYKAPSGMFSEGTSKWQMYQFMASDAERTAQLRAGQATATGSLSNSSSNGASYPRPGESARSPRRQTSR